MLHTKASLAVLSALVATASLSGCCCPSMEMDPPTDGVQVKIEQALSEDQNDEVEAKLKALVAGSASNFASMTINGKATFNLSPVEDPQAFADKIDFGTVEKIEGRVIYLEVNEDAL